MFGVGGGGGGGYWHYFVPFSSFAIILMRKRELHGCFALIVFQVACDC